MAEEPVTADTLTTTEAQQVLGLGSPRAARQQLARWGIKAVARNTTTGEKLWPADQVHAAAANRPGRGHRSDLHSTKEKPDPANRRRTHI